MPLKRKVDTVTHLQREWGKGAPKVTDAIKETLDDIGELLAKGSAARAPYETGELEMSMEHKVSKDGLGRWRLVIDTKAVVNGVRVDDYAYVIHEGEYKLGDGSKAKQAGQKEIVGPNFMGRTLDAEADFIEDYLFDAVWNAIK